MEGERQRRQEGGGEGVLRVKGEGAPPIFNSVREEFT